MYIFPKNNFQFFIPPPQNIKNNSEKYTLEIGKQILNYLHIFRDRIELCESKVLDQVEVECQGFLLRPAYLLLL